MTGSRQKTLQAVAGPVIPLLCASEQAGEIDHLVLAGTGRSIMDFSSPNLTFQALAQTYDARLAISDSAVFTHMSYTAGGALFLGTAIPAMMWLRTWWVRHSRVDWLHERALIARFY